MRCCRKVKLSEVAKVEVLLFAVCRASNQSVLKLDMLSDWALMVKER